MPLSHGEALVELERAHQAEMAAATADLTEQLALSEQRLTTTLQQRDQWRFETERLESELGDVRAAFDGERAAWAEREAAYIARIRVLEGATEPPPPPPLPPRVYIGACPDSGKTPADVINKYGGTIADVAIRTFSDPADGFNRVTRPTGASIWHHSWKPTTLPTDAEIQDRLTAFRNGDIVTLHHESDVKYRNGSIDTLEAQRLARMQTEFHAAVSRLRDADVVPQVRTCVVYAGWMLDNVNNTSGMYPGNETNPAHAAFWGKNAKADLVGVDMDAYGATTKYPNFVPLIGNTIEFMRRWGHAGWTIPEFMHNRISSDTTGSLRASWLTAMTDAILAAEVLPAALMFFDRTWSGRPNQPFVVPSPEWTAVKALQAKAAGTYTGPER